MCCCADLHPEHACCHGYPLLDIRVTLVTPSCTRLLPWLPHPGHTCYPGYPILDIHVAVVTPPCTHVLPWLPHPGHTCCLGYPILLTPVAMVTPSWTHVLPWLPRCCCSRLLLWLHIHYMPVAMVTVVVHAFMSVSLWFPHTPVAMATRIPHACCHGDPSWAVSAPIPHPPVHPPCRHGSPIPHTRVVAVPPLAHTHPHACHRGFSGCAQPHTRVAAVPTHACCHGYPPPIATVTAATPAAWLVATVTGRHGYRSPRLPVVTVPGRHGYRSPWLPVAAVTPPVPSIPPGLPRPPRRHGNLHPPVATATRRASRRPRATPARPPRPPRSAACTPARLPEPPPEELHQAHQEPAQARPHQQLPPDPAPLPQRRPRQVRAEARRGGEPGGEPQPEPQPDPEGEPEPEP